MSGSSDIEDHEGSSDWNQSAKGPAAGSGAGEGQDRDNDASGSGLTPLCQSAMHVSLWRLASERASQNTATVIFTAAAIVSGSCQPTSRRHAVGLTSINPMSGQPQTASAGEIEMQLSKVKHTVHTILVSGLTVGVAACGGGSGSTTSAPTSTTPAPQAGNVAVLASDASSDDWSTIGVKILGISLSPQGGGSPVTVFTAPTTPPVVNLEQLDQISEICGLTRQDAHRIEKDVIARLRAEGIVFNPFAKYNV